MNPNSDQVAAIKTYVAAMSGGWNNTDEQIRTAMQADLVANPVPQGQVPISFTASTIISSNSISTSSVAKMLALPSFDNAVIPLLNLTNKATDTIEYLNAWAMSYFKGGALTQSEFDYLAAPAPGTTANAPVGLFNQTVADPSWASQVGWDVANLGRPIDDFDIETARNK